MRKFRLTAAATAGVVALSGFLVGVAPAMAQTSEESVAAPSAAAACQLLAYTPIRDGSNAKARGGRTGCSNQVSWLDVRLMHQQPGVLPDTIVASNRYNNVTTMTNGTAQTTGRLGAVYFTRTASSTGTTRTSATYAFN